MCWHVSRFSMLTVVSIRIGQLARYMDDHYTRYGFFTIYEYTWFVKLIDDTHFAMSPPISTTAQSSANSVSLRECLLAIALRASDDRASYYGTRHGSKLVGLPRGTLEISHCC